MQTPTFHQKLDHLFIRSHDAGKASDFGRHIRHGGALVHRERLDRFACILHHLRQRLAAAHVIERKNLQDEIFRRDVRLPFAPNDDLHRLRHLDANVFRNPGVEYVGRADAEGDASDGAYVRRVRIGANVHLPRQRIGLQHHRVADAFRTFAVGKLAVQFDSLLLREILLLQLELRGQVEQPHFFLFFGDHFVEKGEMVAEEANARGIVHRNIFANVLLVKDGSHRRDVLMAEAQIDAGKASVARLDRCHFDLAFGSNHVPSKDLLRESHGPRSISAHISLKFEPVVSLYRRQKNLSLHPRHVERKQSTVFNHLLRDLVLPSGEFTERDFFAGTNPVNQREVSRSQQPEVLAVLLVDALNVLPNRDLNSGAHLRIRRLLATGSFAATLAAHRAHETALLHIAASNRQSVAAPQPNIGDFAERPIKVETAVRGSDLIGRNVVTEFGIVRRILRVPRQIPTRQLFLDQLRVFSEKQNAPLQPHLVGALFDLAFKQRRNHVSNCTF